MLNQDPIAATEGGTPKLSFFGSLTTDVFVLGGAFGLAFLGVAITYVNTDLSYLYWLTMIPVFGTICFIVQWSRSQGTGVKWTSLLIAHGGTALG
jgi:hypothetical protein